MVGVPGVGAGVPVAAAGRVLGAGVGEVAGFCDEQPTRPTSATTVAPRAAMNGKRVMKRGLRRKAERDDRRN